MCGIFQTIELYTNYKRSIRTCVGYSKLLNCILTINGLYVMCGIFQTFELYTNYKRTIRTSVGYSKLLNCILTIAGLYVQVWDIPNF